MGAIIANPTASDNTVLHGWACCGLGQDYPVNLVYPVILSNQEEILCALELF
jgi:hypothetical protein